MSQNGGLVGEQLGDFQWGLFEHEWLFLHWRFIVISETSENGSDERSSCSQSTQRLSSSITFLTCCKRGGGNHCTLYREANNSIRKHSWKHNFTALTKTSGSITITLGRQTCCSGVIVFLLRRWSFTASCYSCTTVSLHQSTVFPISCFPN